MNTYNYLGIQIHRKNPEFVSEFSKTLLEGHYTRTGETIPQAFARAATSYCFGDYELAQRIYDYVYAGYFMFASPVLSNATKGYWIYDPEKEGIDKYWYKHYFRPEEKATGLPISCFAFNVPDTAVGQVEAIQELATLSMSGGGTGAHNSIRGTSKKAPGPIPYQKMLDSSIGYFKQGNRRGAIAYYMDVDHPDTIEHIKFRTPGGDSKRRSDNRQQFHTGVNLTDEFIEAVLQDKEYDLKCPHSGKIFETLRARHVWETMIETRAFTGEPFMLKVDLANRKMPETQQKMGLKIRGSNLCLAPTTLVLTDKGELPIAPLADSWVNVWNGEEFTPAWVEKTGVAKSLTRVTTHDLGMRGAARISCTPEHIWYVQRSGEAVQTTTAGLEIDDVVTHYYLANDGGVHNHFGRVSSITENDSIQDTYCLNEPKLHKAVFNGILTGQCSEITLPTDEQRTFVCCLSSLNLERFEEWKDTNIVQDLIRFLDNVLESFICNAPTTLAKAKYSAERERALGLGTFGWHSLLQSKDIPFESGGFGGAIQLTHQIFSLIKARGDESSKLLAVERGEAPDMIGTGFRNSRRTAIAPNANSADIAGTSASIEPLYRNVFLKETRAGMVTLKNRYLEAKLEALGMNTKKVWDDIQAHEGSIQHLKELTDHDRLVFKTAIEIDQHWLVEQANQRGRYICQAQSLNLYFAADADWDYVLSVHWRFLLCQYILTLYYYRTEREAKVDTVKDVERKALVDWNGPECVACQG